MPDVILAHSSAAVAPLLQASRTIPIVFTLVADPVGAGYVSNLARPGGNVTGFTNFEYSIGGKWLELLKEIAPNVTRAAVLRESFVASGPGQFGAIQAASQRLGIELRPIDLPECRRDRARYHGIWPAGFAWRADRDRKPGGDGPPRPDQLAGAAATGCPSSSTPASTC